MTLVLPYDDDLLADDNDHKAAVIDPLPTSAAFELRGTDGALRSG